MGGGGGLSGDGDSVELHFDAKFKFHGKFLDEFDKFVIPYLPPQKFIPITFYLKLLFNKSILLPYMNACKIAGRVAQSV